MNIVFTKDFVFEITDNRVFRYPVLHSINQYEGFHSESVGIKSWETAETVINKMLKIQEDIKIERQLVESFKGLSIEQVMSHPSYSHSRCRDYGVTFYAYSSSSPSGFCSVGGCGNEELSRVRKCLSPTEKR